MPTAWFACDPPARIRCFIGASCGNMLRSYRSLQGLPSRAGEPHQRRQHEALMIQGSVRLGHPCATRAHRTRRFCIAAGVSLGAFRQTNSCQLPLASFSKCP
jgi:hypothetical protein